MTEVITQAENPLSNIPAIVEEMKSPKKFNLADALNQVSYPTGKVTVYLDGAKAGEMLALADEILDLELLAATQSAKALGGITDAPEKEATDDKIAELEARQAILAAGVLESKLTFHMRGVAPAVWRAIDKKARATIKPKDKTNEDHVYEAQLERNAKVNIEMVAHAVVKIEDANGDVDESGLTPAVVQSLHDTLLEIEWEKVRAKMEELSFAAKLFDKATELDADFLPQP